MPSWHDLADRLDQVVVHTFDNTGVTLQKMAAGAPSGAPIPIAAEFDSAYVDESVGSDGMVVSTTRPAAWIHYADLPAGVTVEPNDRIVILAPAPNADTYIVDSLVPNGDNTGVMLRLKKSFAR